MQTIKLSSRGNFSLPPSMRKRNDWAAGTEFSIEDFEGRVVLTPLHAPKPIKKLQIEDVVGCMGYVGKPVSIAEMDEAIANEVKARHARGRY